MTAPLVYSDNTRKLIHDLKFNEQIHLANALITHLFQYYQNRCVEVLIPVPLHYIRLLERGFNQSEEIARILSDRLNIPLDTKSLTRVRMTEPQSGLSINKRRQNLLKAFRFEPQKCYRSVAIVDDIITTGSTLTEISKVLSRSGVTHIEVWSLARALKHD
jgi:ComF family protein